MGFYTEQVVPRLIDFGLAQTPFPKERKKLLQGVQGVLLEVGFGSGLSLPHYPLEVTKLYVLDPSATALKLARKRIATAPFPVQVLPFDGGRYPLPDASCDWVTSMFTLCTIADVPAALAEVRRVLKPGGRFRFMEHGAAEEPGILRWQHWLNPIQRTLFDGCEFDRPIDGLIGSAGFASVSLTRERPPKLVKLMGRLYEGTAVR